MSINESWSFTILQERMETMLFERTAISQKPEETILNGLKTLENEKIEKQILELNE